MRVTSEQKQAHRTRLLEAAAAEFAASGVDGANVNRISLAAGLAKGTIYNYFPSKHDLFLAVVEEASSQAATGAGGPGGRAPPGGDSGVGGGSVSGGRRHGAGAIRVSGQRGSSPHGRAQALRHFLV